ncbi:CotH kinase family protein [Chloroflexota bacterium]
MLKLFGLGCILLLAMVLVWVLRAGTPVSARPRSSLTITMFMASNNRTLADEDGDFPDWIIVHNAADTQADLGGWYLTDDERDLTKWQFPRTTLPGRSDLVVFASGKDRAFSASELHTNFRLKSRGEYLALVESNGTTIASDYAPKVPEELENLPFPWVGRLMRRRGIEPDYPQQFADVPYGRDAAMYERYFATPASKAADRSAVTHLGPIVSGASHAPSVPTTDDILNVSVDVADSLARVSDVTLHYRVMYGDLVTVPMLDDGRHDDGTARDGIYGASIPSRVHQPGDMVRYYITATDLQGNSSRWPLFNKKRNAPEYLGTVVVDPSVMTVLPVLQWFVADPTAAEEYSGTRASVFFDGILYDNVFVRLRGYGNARTWPKKSLKFDFNKGYYFRFSPDQAPVEEFNLASTYSDKSYIRQILAWETYQDAGVAHSVSFPTRVQQNGAFYSIGVFVEQPDKRYLERQGLDPDGALYKMYNPLNSATDDFRVRKRSRLSEDNSDLQALVDGIHQSDPALKTNYLFDQVNIPAAINYLAATTIIHDNDHLSVNYYLYRDSERTGEWTMLPWDKDLTFGRSNLKGDIGPLNDIIRADDDPYSHPLLGSHLHRKDTWNHLIDALYESPTIRQMYLRRLRTLMDELLQPPDTPEAERHYERRIDQLFAQMQPDVALDAAKWTVEWGEPQTFAKAVGMLKDEYLATRRVHLYETHSTARGGIIPDAQPIDARVEFGTIDFAPASGDPSEEYFSLHSPNQYAVDLSGWVVTGDVEYTFEPGVVIPAGGILYVSPDVVAFRNRETSPSGGEGRFVQGDYRGTLSNGWGLLILINAEGMLVTSQTFGGLGPSRRIAAEPSP